MKKGLIAIALGALIFTAAAEPFLEFMTIGQYRRAMLVLALGGAGLLVASWAAARLPLRVRPWGHGLAHLLAVGVLAIATVILVQTLFAGQYRRAIAALACDLVGLMVLAYNTSRLSQAKELSPKHLWMDAALLAGLLVAAALFSEFFFLGQFRRAILVASLILALLALFALIVGSRVGRGKVWVPEGIYLLALLGCLGSVPFFWIYLSAGQLRRALLSLAAGGVCAVLASYWTATVEPEGDWWGW